MREFFGFAYAGCAVASAVFFGAHLLSTGMNGSRDAGCVLLGMSIILAGAAYGFLKLSEVIS